MLGTTDLRQPSYWVSQSTIFGWFFMQISASVVGRKWPSRRASNGGSMLWKTDEIGVYHGQKARCSSYKTPCKARHNKMRVRWTTYNFLSSWQLTGFLRNCWVSTAIRTQRTMPHHTTYNARYYMEESMVIRRVRYRTMGIQLHTILFRRRSHHPYTRMFLEDKRHYILDYINL